MARHLHLGRMAQLDVLVEQADVGLEGFAVVLVVDAVLVLEERSGHRTEQYHAVGALARKLDAVRDERRLQIGTAGLSQCGDCCCTQVCLLGRLGDADRFFGALAIGLVGQRLDPEPGIDGLVVLGAHLGEHGQELIAVEVAPQLRRHRVAGVVWVLLYLGIVGLQLGKCCGVAALGKCLAPLDMMQERLARHALVVASARFVHGFWLLLLSGGETGQQ